VKLEVGKWYRYYDKAVIILALEKPSKGQMMKHYPVKYNLLEYGKFSTEWDTWSELNFSKCKPLEKLTPKEALILLGNGFELKKNFDNKFNVFVKLSGNFIEAKHDNGGRYTVVNLMDTTNILVCPNEFTIHALPEGE